MSMRAFILGLSLGLIILGQGVYAQSTADASSQAADAASLKDLASKPASAADAVLKTIDKSAPLVAAPALMAKQPIKNGRWPNDWALSDFVDAKGQRHAVVFNAKNFAAQWGDVNEKMAELLKVKKLNISPEYVSYRMGATALLEPARYSAQYTDLPSLTEKTPNPAPWITLIQPRDQKETNCMTISVADGQVQGCGDVWQGGLTPDKVACFQGQTYVKCQLKCIESIYSRKLAYTPGLCASAAAAAATPDAKDSATK